MKKIAINITARIHLTFNEYSDEFIESYESYKEIIDSKATKEDMLNHVAWYIASYGTDKMIEGVGTVSVDGKKQGDGSDWCGIDIDSSDFTLNGSPEFETEIEQAIVDSLTFLND